MQHEQKQDKEQEATERGKGARRRMFRSRLLKQSLAIGTGGVLVAIGCWIAISGQSHGPQLWMWLDLIIGSALVIGAGYLTGIMAAAHGPSSLGLAPVAGAALTMIIRWPALQEVMNTHRLSCRFPGLVIALVVLLFVVGQWFPMRRCTGCSLRG